MTQPDVKIDKAYDISTHTLTWSVTCTQVITHEGGNFNSHAHVERDRKPKVTEIDRIISTHTLTWSVTTSFMWGRKSR